MLRFIQFYATKNFYGIFYFVFSNEKMMHKMQKEEINTPFIAITSTIELLDQRYMFS